jgi:hypothetical protein
MVAVEQHTWHRIKHKESILKPLKVCGIISLSLFLISMGILNQSYAQSLVTIAVMPFEINAEKDMDFLQEGLMDMLNSRLTWQGRVDPVEKSRVKSILGQVEEFTGQSRAIMAGTILEADYVLYGSITMIGTHASIDANIVDITGKTGLLPFSKQINGIGNVIPEINRFATDINETVFKRPVVREYYEADQTRQTQSGQSPFGGAFIMADSDEFSTGRAGQVGSVPNQGFEYIGQNQTQGNYWQSSVFDSRIRGIDIGDVDKDGRNETIVVSDDAVIIYRGESSRFVQIEEIHKSRIDRLVSVDVADINGNGIPEIFVSALNGDRDQVKSFVLEYDGSQYRKIAEKMEWYFRVVDKSETPVLLGQRHRLRDDIYSSPIHRMAYRNSEYQPENIMLSGKKINVLGVAYGDITGNGSKEFIVFDKNDHIRIMNENGGERLKTLEQFGGNTNHFIVPAKNPTDPGIHQFFPLRLDLADTNKDGETEVITPVNSQSVLNLLQRIKMFDKGHIESLFWSDTGGLAKYWKTPPIRGYISDFAMGDFDNDGTDELVMAVIQNDKVVSFSGANSRLIGYDL